MADIGVLPTRTAVQITSTTGENGTIPAATPKQAGVMSADQADQLATLYAAHQVSGNGMIVIERPSTAQINTVTRDELRNALTQMQRAITANAPVPQIAYDPDLSSRIQALEQFAQCPPAVGLDLDQRVNALEDNAESQRAHLQTIARSLETVWDLVQSLQGQQEFIEKHALARVDLKQGIAA